ncbi:MAG: hypothetical protein HZY73_03175 [Micropruina sp.]|nr:MAG: hypothetical protein HZY73_03175 [Micropruina sp.]
MSRTSPMKSRSSTRYQGSPASGPVATLSDRTTPTARFSAPTPRIGRNRRRETNDT